MWASFVELLQTLLFALASLHGGSIGWAIISLSLIIRLALLPVTTRLRVP